ncbi:MAG: GNAT family N-acetyltransferase [Micropruina sp.]|nr:GNAT family N-acetyltransferase [Micropruina sp.]
MNPLFAEYQPGDAGIPRPVNVRGLVRANLDECVALTVQREGGDAAAWRSSLERGLGADDLMTFVAVLDGRVAGYGTAGWFAPSTLVPGSISPDGWYLLGLVVDPLVRRRGVGRELTQARLSWLHTRTDRVWYFVSRANLASIDLHAELGFHLVANNIDVPGVAFTATGQLYSADLRGRTALAACRSGP